MTKTPYRLSDIGDEFTWSDLRDFITNLPPSQDCALYRVQHPQSWWWTPEIDFLGAVMTAIQWGNWQRGGGKGDKPQPVKRPVDKPKPTPGAVPASSAELQTRKEALKQSIERTHGGN
jgi:hypothetical protein